jgi:hypothetical protein
MNLAKTLAAVLVLWSSTAWGATLTWDADSETDLAGYRVYQCSLQPCTASSGNASLFVTLGKGTSFNIGTPAVTQYYFITAYDFANNESSGSNVATVTPGGSPPPPPASVAPITFDAASSSEGTTSTSHSATIASDANLALVCVASAAYGLNVQQATSVTIGGEAATHLVGFNQTADNIVRADIWYTLAPPTGSQTVAVTSHASTNYTVTGVMTFKGVAQSSTFNTTATAAGHTANADIAHLASAVGEMGVMCGGFRNEAATVSPDAGKPVSVERFEREHATRISAGGFGYTEDGAVTSIAMRVNLSVAKHWTVVGVSLRPAH